MPFVKIFSILFYECRFFNRSFSEMQLYIKLFVAQQNYGGQWHLCVGKQVFSIDCLQNDRHRNAVAAQHITLPVGDAVQMLRESDGTTAEKREKLFVKRRGQKLRMLCANRAFFAVFRKCQERKVRLQRAVLPLQYTILKHLPDLRQKALRDSGLLGRYIG